MNRRQARRLRRRAVGVLVPALLLGGLAAPGSAADIPPQEPGVTLRSFDLQVPLTELCALKPGQTPNVDELKPVIDWHTTEDFGLTDHFLSQVIANIDIPEEGAYTFRLISDDGSRLLVDDQLVIDHDGLHSAEPKDGTVHLTPGHHPLRIDYFDNTAEQRLTLQWRPPGATGFTVVPNEVLSTDADVVRVTAPGQKECEGGLDTPGDGLPLDAVHPNYDLTDLRPAGFEPQVSALDWLPDDRLAVATWGGTDNVAGEVYLLDNVTGATGPDQVTHTRIAEGLNEPMGLAWADGALYVSEKHQLTRLVDTDGDEVTDIYETVAEWPYGGNFHEFAFGLLHADGSFYLNLSVAIDLGGATTDPQPAPDRGTTIRVDQETGEIDYLAGGLRTPHGIGWGPAGELFVTDNQGGWLPSSKLLHVERDRFFNHHTNPPGPFDDNPVTQPVLWLPQNEIGNSPSTPVHLTEGPFAGQLLIGDVTYGGLQRAYLEQVEGAYQGAVFRHTQGLEAGVTRVSVGPDGALYTGGLGAGGNWGQEGKLAHGLQKLTPNGGNAFDIHEMRATPDGFVLSYTQPLSQETADRLATAYQVDQWRYEPTADYGGPKLDQQTLQVTSAELSADRTEVTLTIEGLRTDRVVHVQSPRPFSSADGEPLWSTEAWYTLNALPAG
ncbi:PA14 domain-containing protein [Streptomyces sp. DSM 44915]|uniref:PA14 domain-containing protein n=1 Tax=Streptomyces chisholmiae TaxID=3075540 RepID=A0ABU2JPG4_9ACTN|nr:PA14 domain-containing protein [Streptomyces sp. DSM 44915]MDT0266604.1 PA14 domain-containing protein [Streptomyces sp. DSM 44915]